MRRDVGNDGVSPEAMVTEGPRTTIAGSDAITQTHSQQVSIIDAYAYCRRVTQLSSSNFYHAFRLLSRDKHNALCALYAFCRFVDDIADGDTVPEEEDNRQGKEAQISQSLSRWNEELTLCYRGTPSHPISKALADAIRSFPIKKEHLAGIIDGVGMDLSQVRYATFSDLYEYCYRVASLVGLVCIEIFGYRSETARDYAVNLGIAFQLTNIIRDVGEDARRGRIYLPLEDLRRFGCTESMLLKEKYDAAFVDLMKYQSARANEYYSKALSFLAPADRRSLMASEAMRLIYQRLLKEIELVSFSVFDRRVALSGLRKISLAFRAWGRGRLPF